MTRHTYTITILLILLILPSVSVCSKQHTTIEALIQQSSKCNMPGINNNLSETLNIQTRLNKNFNLIPINNCVLRSNRYFLNYSKLLTKDLNIKTIVNFDLLSHSEYEISRQYKQISKKKLDYYYLHINVSQYPQAESALSLLTTLQYLSEATPDNKALITCFFGGYRTGLVSGIYHFLHNYSQDSVSTCQQRMTDKDTAYQQLFLTNQVHFPFEFKDFYQDFTESVCNQMSFEFFNEL